MTLSIKNVFKPLAVAASLLAAPALAGDADGGSGVHIAEAQFSFAKQTEGDEALRELFCATSLEEIQHIVIEEVRANPFSSVLFGDDVTDNEIRAVFAEEYAHECG